MPTGRPPSDDVPARLATLPWADLASIGADLAAPLAEILSGTPAERILDRTLRAHRAYTPSQRTLVAECLFGVGLWRRRLSSQCPEPNPEPLRLLAIFAHALGGRSEAARWLGLPNVPLLPTPAAWPVRHSIPDWLAQTLLAETGSVADASLLAAAINVPGPICLRANRLKTSPEALAAGLLAAGIASQPGRWCPDALILSGPRPNLYGLEPHRRGDFEVQDEGSQLIGAMLEVRPGDEVLDLCAGAGGKTLLFASALAGQGTLHATDVDLSRLDRLRTRAARAGAVVRVHGARAPDSLRVSHVLVDAPCSELGALRRGPDLRWRLEPQGFAGLPALQLELLDRAAHHLAPGGRLVYATCTFRRAENEDVVARFLATHPDFACVRPRLPHSVLGAGSTLKVFPHRHGTDGFFAAALQRGT
jgi:16S rRNA (cytosine967-C5)-methyltransferase